MKLLHKNQRAPSHFQPWQYEALRLWVVGVRREEITEATGRTLKEVQALLNSPAAKVLLDQIHDGTLQTVRQVQASLQAIAPRALEKMRQNLESKNPLVSHRAAVWVLEAAGHSPLRAMVVRHINADQDDLAEMTVEQLRQRAIAAISQRPLAIETTAIVEDSDGNPHAN